MILKIWFDLVVLTGKENKHFSTGKYKILNKPRSTNETFEEERERKTFMEEYSTGLKDRVEALLKFYDDSNEKGLKEIKRKENIEVYKTFVDICLVQLKDSMTWTYECDHKKVSEIFTASDEAMAALYFENLAADFQKMRQTGRKLAKNESRTRFTNNSKQTCQGWHVDGIKRYNVLIKAFVENRRHVDCIELEEEVRNDMVAFKNCKKTIADLTAEEMQVYSFNEVDDNSDEDDVDALDETEYEKTLDTLNVVGV